ncbi:MAG: TIGR00269 family protein [Sphingomonadaceae bacterium]
MRCTRCGGEAWIELRRHNAAYCDRCFLHAFEEQVGRAIHRERMFAPEDRVLVAVSGGKDSLALWDVLQRLGYRASGLHLDLGIEGYSAVSRRKVEAFASERGLELIVVDYREELGGGVDSLYRKVRRNPCSACGLSKRHFFNRVALERGFDVVATGHNLDDEAASLLGNLLHWRVGYLSRQSPVMESTHPHMVRKVKPLFRLTERETAAYAILRGIDYVVDECPLSEGARSLLYKEILNRLEAESPGAKHSFLFGYLERGRSAFREAGETVHLRECELCGQPTTEPLCAFCRMKQLLHP